MGDGQKVSLRAQASSYYRTYSASFSEPWFGKVKPVSFSSSVSYTTQYYQSSTTSSVDKSRRFDIISLSAGIAKRLTVPDDYFSLSQTVSYQHYNLHNYDIGLFTFGDGASRNLAYTIGLSRSNKGVNPIFPVYGSEFSLVAKFTLPYSLFDGVNYGTLDDQKEYKYIYSGSSYYGDNGILVSAGDYLEEIPSTTSPTPNSVVSYKDAVADPSLVDQEKYKWLEYYKIKFKAEWYTKIYGKLILKSSVEYGFLGAYNQDRGVIPFERFYLGGDGMANYSMDGRETVGLRGYANSSLTPVNSSGETIGGTVYNKYSLEMRYPITLKPSASIYALSFFEAGSAFSSFGNYNPFSLSRSAGAGIRIFMPAFGLLGIDFGYGFDGLPQSNGTTSSTPHGWETHFIIGQQF
jgi:outer membrane protein insertion porin family